MPVRRARSEDNKRPAARSRSGSREERRENAGARAGQDGSRVRERWIWVCNAIGCRGWAGQRRGGNRSRPAGSCRCRRFLLEPGLGRGGARCCVAARPMSRWQGPRPRSFHAAIRGVRERAQFLSSASARWPGRRWWSSQDSKSCGVSSAWNWMPPSTSPTRLACGRSGAVCRRRSFGRELQLVAVPLVRVEAGRERGRGQDRARPSRSARPGTGRSPACARGVLERRRPRRAAASRGARRAAGLGGSGDRTADDHTAGQG